MKKDLDTVTALKLGEALYNFMARKGDDADADDFAFEDAGLDIRSGFIEIDSDTLWNVSLLLDGEGV